ncbi:uncharacterized protein [Malus domestica]|uniref:uncharacterized protein n=1 Tax=Malus domestica TaxID=3750 RepID=UPI0039750A60
MANLTKLDFTALDITGKIYLTWVLDTKIHLEARNLGDTIREENNSSFQDRAKAMIFIRRHLDEGLESEYLTVEDPLALWKTLRNRYNHQTTVIFPIARYEWTHLRIQDFKSVAEYNSALFRITSQMKLCGAEQNNELLMKNHQSRPTGSTPFPEVNDASLEMNATSSRGDNHKRRRGHKRGRWNRKGKNHGGQFHNQVPRHNSGQSFKNVNRHKGKAHMNNAPRSVMSLAIAKENSLGLQSHRNPVSPFFTVSTGAPLLHAMTPYTVTGKIPVKPNDSKTSNYAVILNDS